MLTALLIGLGVLLAGSVAYNLKQRHDNKTKEHQVRDLRTQVDAGDRTRTQLEDNLARLTAAANALRTRIETTEAQLGRYKGRNTELKNNLDSQTEENSTLRNRIAELEREFEEGTFNDSSNTNAGTNFSNNPNRVDFLSTRREGAKAEHQSDPTQFNIKQ